LKLLRFEQINPLRKLTNPAFQCEISVNPIVKFRTSPVTKVALSNAHSLVTRLETSSRNAMQSHCDIRNTRKFGPCSWFGKMPKSTSTITRALKIGYQPDK
jgi:hypothetical protein